MRLWSIHTKYLDSIGIVALWREGLLAKKVFQGRTKGYRHHPQLIRFRSHRSPIACIESYLRSVWIEAVRRGYSFDKRKLGRHRRVHLIPISMRQLEFELDHLRRKLSVRNVEQFSILAKVKKPSPHPLFKVRKGAVEEWERR
jgi:hypothetical protein